MTALKSSPAPRPGTPPHPPWPPPVFRVGIVGHRPHRLKEANLEALRETLQQVLGIIQAELAAARVSPDGGETEASPRLRALSPLAEGTDRLFAEAALNQGAELCCVMPFPQAEFERDFQPDRALESDSLENFRRLLARATTRFELDGRRADEAAAYGAAGTVVLNQSDLLVVVWDGIRTDKRGGTEETFAAARARSVPVVWVDAHAPHAWQLVDARHPLPPNAKGRLAPRGEASEEALRQQARRTLEWPAADAVAASSATPGVRRKSAGLPGEARRFRGETQPRWTWAVMWKAFQDLVGDRKFPRVSFSVPPFEEAVKEAWSGEQTAAGAVIEFLRPFYAWLDRLSVIYADRYRSTFVLAYFLAAGAVGMALLPVGVGLATGHPVETVFILLELLMISTILGMVFQGRRGQWHERWLDYRLAAELIRHLRLVAPLGGQRPFLRTPAHQTAYGHPGASWMAWYVRGVERALGLPSVVITRETLRNCLGHMGRLVGEQREFHAVVARRCERIERRLHRMGFLLLALTFVGGLLHFLPAVCPSLHEFYPAGLPHWLTFVCGFLPALGAALLGISHQGEFRRIAKRSGAMSARLAQLSEEVEALRKEIAEQTERQFSPRVAALAHDIARLMVNEVLDWRVVFLDQPLVPPA